MEIMGEKNTFSTVIIQNGPIVTIEFFYFAALPDCSYTTAKPDVTVVAMDDILFSR